MAVRVSAAVILLSVILSVRCQHSPKPVTSLLRTKWPRAPILLEASEFIASEDGSAFWKFAEATKDIRSSVTNDRDLYEAILEQSARLLPPLAHGLLPLSLALHAHSPAIEMYRQLSRERLNGSGCEAAVEVGGRLVCSMEEVEKELAEEVEGHDGQIFSFDHRYPSLPATPPPPMVVLYAELGTQSFSRWHDSLVRLAKGGRLTYIFRHYIQYPSDERVTLTGYGVELAVKSTEYKAVDDTEVKEGGESGVVGDSDGTEDVQGFLFQTLKTLHPDLTEGLDEFRTHLLQSAREIAELKAWQLQDLGFQASQKIMNAGPQLALVTMRDLAQNLPVQAKSLSKAQVSKELRQEIVHNQRTLSALGVDPGDNILLLDGVVLQDTDVYNVLEVVTSECHLVEGLHRLGLQPENHIEVLKTSVHSEHKTFAVDVRSEAVMFINDLEKDREYSGWPKSLQMFLQPMYAGMLKQVRRNVFTAVFCVDPATDDGRELVEYAKLFVEHLVPIRIGLLLVADPSSDWYDVSAAMVRGFAFLHQHQSPRKALDWLHLVHNLTAPTTADVIGVFRAQYGDKLNEAVEDIFSEQSEYDSLRKQSFEFFQSKGFDALPQVLLNGIQLDLSEDLEMALVNKVQIQTYEVAQAVYMKRVRDSTDMYKYFLTKPSVLPRINKHVISSTNTHVDLSGEAPSDGDFVELSDSAMSAVMVRDMPYYVSSEGEFVTKPVTVWVVVDLSSDHGRELLRNAITFATSQPEFRVGVVVNPGHTHPLHATVLAALYSQERGRGWSLVQALMEGGGEDVPETAQGIKGFDMAAFEEWLESARLSDVIASHVTYSGRVLGLERGACTLVANGKVIGPFLPNETFAVADYQMLHQFESSVYAANLLAALSDLPVDGVGPDDDTADFRSDLIMQTASLLRSVPRRRRINVPALRGEHSLAFLPSPSPSLQLVAYLDPVSTGAQKLAPLLHVLQSALPIELSVYLNPKSKLSEMPVRRFYRYVLEPSLSFTEDGSLSSGPLAVFSDLPHSPLLTLNMDVPHSWLVEVVWSPHDLDNIHLASVEKAVHGVFELEHILVEGQCFDAGSSQPTPGLEYVLGTAEEPEKFDTIVMANLGYFQLKASPGAWTLRLRAGRSADIYAIQSQHGGESVESLQGVLMVVNSFRGRGVILMVGKKPGMEQAHLLEEDGGKEEEEEEEEEGEGEGEGEGQGLWRTLTSFLGERDQAEEGRSEVGGKLEVSDNETINVFSIASGHLYERFLRIMMLGVLKHTHNPVKFWFLKNYLSPTFKEFIPHMAKEYGCDYELVQYKWPRWLHAQTEKQRIIWGYKILFLDVLFPLSVKKIIFVDADQIVRADLRELLEVPLDGAPYAYTPFCNDRPEMEGFRFWNRGYWKNHLGTRSYHISALYLVDLMRFRRLAAGDRLRGQYQALSQDPNSLANLDQDLPNNMIHTVPIKSLPQEWLWCETWCSEESKARAKTIDLCNNPLTKEPKLTAAMRIAPEWVGYDREIRALQERLATETRGHEEEHRHEEL